jgi:hypothetical protein
LRHASPLDASARLPFGARPGGSSDAAHPAYGAAPIPSYAAAMIEVGAQLPALTLRGERNQPVALASLHESAPLAAIVLRHFG